MPSSTGSASCTTPSGSTRRRRTRSGRRWPPPPCAPGSSPGATCRGARGCAPCGIEAPPGCQHSWRMLKTALSASLIALVVLAPAASAADQKPPPEKAPKPTVLDEKAAKLCADLQARGKLRKTGLSKEEVVLQKRLNCPPEEPKPECPPAAKQQRYDFDVKLL